MNFLVTNYFQSDVNEAGCNLMYWIYKVKICRHLGNNCVRIQIIIKCHLVGKEMGWLLVELEELLLHMEKYCMRYFQFQSRHCMFSTSLNTHRHTFVSILYTKTIHHTLNQESMKSINVLAKRIYWIAIGITLNYENISVFGSFIIIRCVDRVFFTKWSC